MTNLTVRGQGSGGIGSGIDKRIVFGQLTDGINWNMMADLMNKDGQPILNKSSQRIKPSIYFYVKGTITAISHSIDRPPWYKACPEADDNGFYGKVIEGGDNSWFCESRNNRTQ